MSINLGIIAGFVSSYALSGLSPAVSWRLMVGLGAVLPVPMFLLSVFVMPESPRHLVRIGAGDRAAWPTQAMRWDQKSPNTKAAIFPPVATDTQNCQVVFFSPSS